MEVISNAIGRTANYLMTIGIADFIDIVIVAYLLYNSIWLIRKNSFNTGSSHILSEQGYGPGIYGQDGGLQEN